MESHSTSTHTSLHVYTCGVRTFDETFEIRREYQTGYHVSVVLDGTMWLRVNETEHRIVGGEAVWFDLRKPYAYSFGPVERPTLRCYARLSGAWADRLFHYADLESNPVISCSERDAGELEARFRLLVHLFDRGKGSAKTEVKREVGEILKTLVRTRLARTRNSNPRQGEARIDSRIAAAKRHIERNTFRNLTLDEIAEHVHLSKFHFLRLFKRDAGMTPKQYLLRCRLVEARKLLVQTDFTVNEIANLCGFGNCSHFTNVFKKFESVSPRAYRQDATSTTPTLARTL